MENTNSSSSVRTNININELNALVNRSISTLNSLLNTAKDDTIRLSICNSIRELKKVIDQNGIEVIKNKNNFSGKQKKTKPKENINESIHKQPYDIKNIKKEWEE